MAMAAIACCTAAFVLMLPGDPSVTEPSPTA